MSAETRHASSDSLLGQLQRGRGAGFLAAGRETTSKVWPLLVDCVTRDPRLDGQVESRDDYYAALIIQTEMNLEPLANHLLEHDDSDQYGWNTGLTVLTLGSLARRGYRDAVAILRDYVAWGEWWDWAVDELVSTNHPATWAGLDNVFCNRFVSDESIKDELGWFDAGDEPWVTWCKQNVRLGQFVGSLRTPGSNSTKYERQDFSNLDVADVLRLAKQDGRTILKLRKIIAHLVKPADFDFLLSQVSIAEPQRSGIALAGLAKLANPAMFGWLRDFWANNPEMPGAIRVRAKEAMEAMPPAQTLPLARDWFDHPDWHFRLLAEDVMKHHATLDDVPRLRKAIASALADDAEYVPVMHIDRGFQASLPGWARLPELEFAFFGFVTPMDAI